MILSMQRFLIEGAEIVWAFPATNEPVQAEQEIPGEVLAHVCR